ncbi:hypothetical protein HPP92_000954 [Vanilla planifolia]|uniref:Origin of replication complex subunit 3 n=1 Tax=Vanilla planifolia TaxID=51239 RepID=A0A835S2F1_VANPL|nr:hypothetical protein HPP92_000954 [Vanilla planifolia]
MVRSPPTSDSLALSVANNELDAADNNLQPFFILRKATLRKSSTKSSSYGKTKKKIDVQSSSPRTRTQELDHSNYEILRLKAFDLTWSKIDSAVKEVLRKININLFVDIHHWVCQSLSTVRSSCPSEVTKPYPIASNVICKRIPTALLFTRNVELIDDLLTFQYLKDYLQSNGCHVAYLSALHVSSKHGVGGCLRSLCRQLISEASDAFAVPLIASWYCEPENYHKPVVIIIDDMERCDGVVLADFVKMLSEWVMKIPFILVMGVATAIDAPGRLLSSIVLHNLLPCEFTLESPARRMDSLIEAILVKSNLGFFIGHKVAVFLRNHFFGHDGTITSFLKALKICCAKHFEGEPLSFLCPGMLLEDSEAFWSSKCETLTEVLKRHAIAFPSCWRWKTLEGFTDSLAQSLSELKSLHKRWSSVLLCLFEVGKVSKIQLLDIFCEAIDPTLCGQSDFDQQLQMLTTFDKISSKSGAKTCFTSEGLIPQVIQKVREIPSETLIHLLYEWSIHLEEMNEAGIQVRELYSKAKTTTIHDLGKENRMDNIHRYSTSSFMGEVTGSHNDQAAKLLVSMIRKLMIPIESVPFHEIVCFKDVAALKLALIGDPRRRIQCDLSKSDGLLRGVSSDRRANILSSFTHDTAIMYSLAQEYGELINLHDWYLSFKTKILNCSTTGKRKIPHSHLSEKSKAKSVENETTIQARFCKAVTELQITGLARMPSKRRPDFLQRIAFDL